MRAVGITATGGPEVLRVIEREIRAAGPDEVRLAVRAAAVNPTDILLRERGVQGVAPPWVPGMDAAGVVESVGPGVDRVAVGDAVMAALTPRRPEGGAQAELVVVPAASVVPLPESASFAEAATLPMNGLTALLALELLALGAGETIAVSGGAGLLASYAITIATLRGLRVVADAKPEDEALVAGFGAELVLPRGEGFPAAIRQAVPGGVDGFLDTALLGRSAFRAIRDGGAMAVVRGWDGSEPERGIEIREVWVSTVFERTDWLLELRALASQARLPLRVVRGYLPEQAAEAQEVTSAGGLRGRVVITFPQP